MSDGIGMGLRKLRLERHYTQREVAERMHMLQSAYSRLENGKVVVTERHLQLLVEVFGKEVIITGLFEPPVRTLRATIPAIESQSKIMILLLPNYLLGRYL